jgi:hypothetical protein
MDMGTAIDPVGAVVQRIAAPAGTAIVTTLLDGTAATPTGYPAAVTVPDGDVLASGGVPDAVAASCAPENQGLICASPQALRYDAATAAAAVTGSLGVPRYGHAMTVAADGTVVVTGGLGTIAGALTALADVEIYEPRGTADDPLGAPAGRPPGEALSPCTIVVEGVDAGP